MFAQKDEHCDATSGNMNSTGNRQKRPQWVIKMALRKLAQTDPALYSSRNKAYNIEVSLFPKSDNPQTSPKRLSL